jgi:hypothetical protein
LIEHNTWRLAKRQMTWFRHISGVHWLSLTEVPAATAIEAIIALICDHWSEQGATSPSASPSQGNAVDAWSVTT